MKIDASTIKKLIELEYWYEHIPARQVGENNLKLVNTGYLYFKAEEILPLLETLEKGIKE